MQNINIDIDGEERNQNLPSEEIKSLPETDTSKYYMSEEEVREIITRYNTDLNVVLLENEKNKEKVKQLEKEHLEYELKFRHAKDDMAKLENERDHYRQLYDDLQNEIKTKEENIARDQLDKILKFNQQLDDDKTYVPDIIENEVKDETNKTKLLNFYQDSHKLNSNYKELAEKYQTLLANYNEVKSKFEDFENNQHKSKSCILCRQDYYPNTNGPNACQHHSGKLKYYSCRGCGADEYYSCCNRCTTCSKGCKFGKHVSTE